METESKMLPHSVEIEEQVIVSCLLDQNILDECLAMLEPNDFYVGWHRDVFAAMKTIRSKNGHADIVTVWEQVDPSTKGMYSAGKLAKMIEEIPIAINPEYDANKIKGYSYKRQMITTASAAMSMCYDGMSSPEDVLNKLQEGVLEIGTKKKGGLTHIGDSISRIKDQIENLNKGVVVNTGISTGFRDLDRYLGNMQRGDLIILAARPSMGKTTLAMNIAANVARDENMSVDVFSIETSSDKISTRLVCSEARVDSMVFRNGLLSKDDYGRLSSAAEIVETYPIYIDDSPVLSPNDLIRRARRAKKEHNTGLIVVDYLQFMKGDGDHARKDLEIGSITRAAKQCAKELNVPLIMLSQLNRTLENRQNKRPVMSDLRESGAIEQDADVVMFIYRDEVYNDDPANKGIAEIKIAKNRDGMTETAPMSFIAKHTRFENFHK